MDCEKYGQESDEMSSVCEPQLTDRSLNKLHLCILAVTICEELAAAKRVSFSDLV